MNNNRLRVLIVAHEFSPIKGSESAVGWNLVTRIAQYHDVTVLYASGSQFNHNSYVDVITKYFLTSPPVPGLTCINIDKPPISRIFARINSPFRNLSMIGFPVFYYLGYKYWQKSVLKEVRRLHEINRFDIVHQLTQITFREPGYLWKLGIPFIWGPTGGTTTFPSVFRRELSLQSKTLISIRSISNYFQFRFSSRIAKANRKASIIYAFSKKDAERLKRLAQGQVKIMLDVGTYKKPEIAAAGNHRGAQLKGIWCGRISDFKAPSILLRALAGSQATKEKISFTIIGKGNLEKQMLDLAKELELKNIEWIREVKHARVFELMADADFFVHTSIQEATSSVITEALTMGLPVICHDAFGMSIAVNESCGIKVPFKSPEVSISGFHSAMEKLLINSNLLAELKKGAYKRSLEISWDVMAETIAKDYLEIIHGVK